MTMILRMMITVLQHSWRGDFDCKDNYYEASSSIQVCLPCARHGYNAEMTRVDGCAYHAPDVNTWAGVLTMCQAWIQCLDTARAGVLFICQA